MVVERRRIPTGRMPRSWKMISGSGRGRGRRNIRRQRGDSAVWRRVLAVDDWYACHSLGGGGRVCHIGRFQFGGQLPFPLVASVLEPDLDLGFRQTQWRRQGGPLGARQVAFYVEHRFQLVHLAFKTSLT